VKVNLTTKQWRKTSWLVTTKKKKRHGFHDFCPRTRLNFSQDAGVSATQAKKNATVERQVKKQKRKVAEDKLHIKRQEMDKAKASLVRRRVSMSPGSFGVTGCGCGQTVLVSSRPNRTIQTFRRHQGELWCQQYDPNDTYHFQRAADPEYAAMMDAQPKPKGRGRKKAM